MFAPLHQDPSYHHFADPLGSLLSNAAFFLTGATGLWLARHQSMARRMAALGCLLVGFGSAWYHAGPSDASLVWDRLPMTIVFAAVFTEALARFTGASPRHWLGPLLLAGLTSVVWWHATGDLRPYALVQFGPLAILPVWLLRDSRRNGAWWALLALYAAAKLCEHFDAGLFTLTGHLAGGHTLKHLAAAAALWCWLRSAECRRLA